MAHGRMFGLGGSMEGRSTRPPLARRGLAWGLSSVGEHLLCKQGVTGSNPVASTIFPSNSCCIGSRISPSVAGKAISA